MVDTKVADTVGADTTGDELRALEQQLMAPPQGVSIDTLAKFMAEEFLEIGSSGKRYNKQQALHAMQQRQAGHISMSDFQVRMLAPDVALVTYRAQRQTKNETVPTLRSSLWKREHHQWKLVFHQGTVINTP